MVTVTNLASGLRAVTALTSLVTIHNSQWLLDDICDPPGPRGPDAPGPSVRLRLTTSETRDAARASGWFGRRDPWYGETVQLYTAVHLYTALLWALLYNLNPTINCRRFSLFTHTAGHNYQAGGRESWRRRNKRELFLTSLLASNCFSLSLPCRGITGLRRI